MWRRSLVLGAVAVAAVAGGGVAQGELNQEGNLVVSLNGDIAPHALPRETPAPVKVHVKGEVRTANGDQPPALRQLTIALNRHGRLFTRGLPTCEPEQLQGTSTEGALDACRPALVGRGHFDAKVAFPTLAPFPARGDVLVFNGRKGGKQTIILHTFGTTPTPVTFVLPLTIDHRRSGDFGVIISASLPRIAADLGYVTGIEFSLNRRFLYRGRVRSYLSASCAAPDGFPGALFVLAKATFRFANGQRLRTAVVRDCKVR